MKLWGNTSGLSPAETKSLERLYRRRVPFDVLTTPELSRSLAEATHQTHRQIGVLIDRSGKVAYVVVGDGTKLVLPDLGRVRAARGRFRGLRLIHTHLRQEPLSRDDLVDLTRLRLDLVAAICISHDGKPAQVYYGHNAPVRNEQDEEPFQTYGPIPHSHLQVNPGQLLQGVEEAFARAARTRKVVAKDGRAILVTVANKRHARRAEDSLRELHELARSAGVDVADEVLQLREHIDPKYVLGRGRLEDVVVRAMQLDVEVLIFDRELTPAQSTAIARMTDLKVLDRTQLILDIFAQRAESRDGKLQVELAQMRYLLPRLGTRDDALSRLTGGIGGRGPGETKLEVGKRRARERIDRLQAQLKRLAKQRVQRRSRRKRRGVPAAAVIGYTNAGKSTLVNSLTQGSVFVEDKLFATLDTRSRRLRLPREQEIVISDTVGFIRELPKELFAAFRATFEEAQDADLLLQVVDAADPAAEQQMRTTDELVIKLGLEHVPRILVFNKVDLLEEPREASRLVAAHNAIAISALNPSSLDALLERMQQALPPPVQPATVPETAGVAAVKAT